MHDSARLRRRIAYPILTLCVAGVIWLFSTGRISTEPRVEPAVYESAAREVVLAAREGRGQLSGDDFLSRTWRRLAPAALQDADGGAFTVRCVDLAAERPDVARDSASGQPVEIALAQGGGAILSLKLEDGAIRVVGIGKMSSVNGGAPEESQR